LPPFQITVKWNPGWYLLSGDFGFSGWNVHKLVENSDYADRPGDQIA
jgi:hypothetical protein